MHHPVRGLVALHAAPFELRHAFLFTPMVSLVLQVLLRIGLLLLWCWVTKLARRRQTKPCLMPCRSTSVLKRCGWRRALAKHVYGCVGCPYLRRVTRGWCQIPYDTHHMEYRDERISIFHLHRGAGVAPGLSADSARPFV